MASFVVGGARHLGALLARSQVQNSPGLRQLSRGRRLIPLRGRISKEYHHCSRTLAFGNEGLFNNYANHAEITPPQMRRIAIPLALVPSFHRRHILSAKQFTKQNLNDLFALARDMQSEFDRYGTLDVLKGKVLCTAFYEPSTCTSASFEVAMKHCGGEIVSMTVDNSSMKEGETLSDTIRALAHYGDAIVLRHPDAGSAQLATECSPVPIFNAGDGVGEHPTQALLDTYTICSELGTLNGRTITLFGDLKHCGTVHSLVTLLSLYSVRLNFVSPPSLAMPPTVVLAAHDAGIPVTICESLDDVLMNSDVLYVSHAPEEGFNNEWEWSQMKGAFRVEHLVLPQAKKGMVVLHSQPRINEIDSNPHTDLRRATYSPSTHNSLFVRMALLASVIS